MGLSQWAAPVSGKLFFESLQLGRLKRSVSVVKYVFPFPFGKRIDVVDSLGLAVSFKNFHYQFTGK